MTALHWAVYNDDAETAGLLVRSRANVNATNRYGVPPLFIACTNGNATLVRLLLDAGANANASFQVGDVLMTAARVGNLEAVKALLARGANPNAQERRGDGAHVGRRRRTRDGRASPHRSGIRDQRNARVRIHAAVLRGARGHIDVVRVLLEAGVNVNETLKPKEDRPARQSARVTSQSERHQSVADGGGERPLRVGDCFGRGWSRSKRSTDGFTPLRDQLGAEAGCQ